LLDAGYDIVVLDNLSNSSEDSISRIKKITGNNFLFYKADLRDVAVLNAIFEEEHIDAVIHFAGLKAVGESVTIPLKYYDNNIGGTLVLC
jgi:UDP-glucose 4-epimerase